MPKMRFQTVIQRQPETIYQLILDFPGYKAWLPASKVYGETALTSDYPVRVGTTYVDRGQASVMYGEVLALEPAKSIVFRQITDSHPGSIFTSSMDITVRYTLKPVAEGTQVTRDWRLRTRGLFFLLQGALLPAIRKENERILAAMKSYLEARVS